MQLFLDVNLFDSLRFIRGLEAGPVGPSKIFSPVLLLLAVSVLSFIIQVMNESNLV